MIRPMIQQAAAAGVLAVGLVVLVAGGPVACTSAAPKPSGEPTAGTAASPAATGAPAGAKALMEKKCSTCHGLDRFEGKKADVKGWTEIVDNMVQRGMRATDPERKEIIDYLASR
jgi:mono/diheme cytochrome c family protein